MARYLLLIRNVISVAANLFLFHLFYTAILACESENYRILYFVFARVCTTACGYPKPLAILNDTVFE